MMDIETRIANLETSRATKNEINTLRTELANLRSAFEEYKQEGKKRAYLYSLGVSNV